MGGICRRVGGGGGSVTEKKWLGLVSVFLRKHIMFILEKSEKPRDKTFSL